MANPSCVTSHTNHMPADRFSPDSTTPYNKEEIGAILAVFAFIACLRRIAVAIARYMQHHMWALVTTLVVAVFIFLMITV